MGEKIVAILIDSGLISTIIRPPRRKKTRPKKNNNRNLKLTDFFDSDELKKKRKKKFIEIKNRNWKKGPPASEIWKKIILHLLMFTNGNFLYKIKLWSHQKKQFLLNFLFCYAIDSIVFSESWPFFRMYICVLNSFKKKFIYLKNHFVVAWLILLLHNRPLLLSSKIIRRNIFMFLISIFFIVVVVVFIVFFLFCFFISAQ